MATDYRDEGTLPVFLRFATVGACFGIVYSCSTAFFVDVLHYPAYWTSVILYLMCVPAAYFVQKRVTFRVEQVRRAAFPIYFATQLVCLSIIAAITTRFVTGNIVIDTGIFMVTAASTALLSFFVSKLFAFKPPA